MTQTGRGNVYIVGMDSGVHRMWFNEGYNVLMGDINKAIENADIICFIGGDDVSPKMYGQIKNKEAHVYESLSADKRDLEAWNLIPKDVLKVGICRGGQFLHVMNGGKLYQDVTGGHGSGHKAYDAVWKKELIITSSHHQMMKAQDGHGDIMTYSEGVGDVFTGEFGPVNPPSAEPEGIWYEGTRSLCLQFHPEWAVKDSTERNYFLNLVDLVRS